MSLRERKQQAAREHVADAASPLFLRDGYVATTTRAVAKAAGVAEGTVFNLFGSKAELLLASLQRSVPDLVDSAVWTEQARAMPDAAAVIEHFSVTGKQVSDAALPLVRVFLEAANVDESVAEAWRRQERFRLDGQKWVLEVLAERGWLRSDRGFDELALDLWLLAAPELHLKWLDAGMGEDEFQRWRRGLLATLLLDPA
ncbi:TetR family transcriptional regulator [Agromyces rhizosphaerae]|uniref:TetR family transcriptional regulator n=2 Tax=Agromyces rhizosphaerae TaxID=88374 RepID=A0A9W6CZM4_9MICO|nr:TetR family transcriptional regulator [Agromyces rhizosphaerae]